MAGSRMHQRQQDHGRESVVVGEIKSKCLIRHGAEARSFSRLAAAERR